MVWAVGFCRSRSQTERIPKRGEIHEICHSGSEEKKPNNFIEICHTDTRRHTIRNYALWQPFEISYGNLSKLWATPKGLLGASRGQRARGATRGPRRLTQTWSTLTISTVLYQYCTGPLTHMGFDALSLFVLDGSPSRLGLQLGASNVKFVHPMATEREI